MFTGAKQRAGTVGVAAGPGQQGNMQQNNQQQQGIHCICCFIQSELIVIHLQGLR